MMPAEKPAAPAKKALPIYETLRRVDVSGHIEKKNGLSYLSWAWAWDTLMKIFPRSYVRIERNQDGRFWFDDGRTGWVEVAVIVDNGVEAVERSELYPVMDYNNRSIPADKITSFNANTAVQRATTKAIARHGLGLYVYAGEDLPPAEEETGEESEGAKKATKQAKKGAAEAQGKKPAEKDAKPMITEGQIKVLQKYAGTANMQKALDYYHVKKVEELTLEQASATIQAFMRKGES